MPSSSRVAADRDPVTDAMDRHAWSEAAAILERTPDPSGDDLARLASCAWWLGDIDRCIDLRERAFRAFLDAGRNAEAAAVAILLVEDHHHKLQDATGRSWLRRAEQLVAERPESVEAGWLARFRAMTAIERDGDAEVAIVHAAEALEVAHRTGDRNLLAIAQHDHGRALVMTGRVEEGLSLMEEVTAAAVAGDLSPLITGKVYCIMIDVSERLTDYQRAGQWDDAARRWCERAGNLSGFPGICRVKRAEIMRLRGRWTEAVAEAELGTRELRHFLDLAGKGFSEIGTIRLLTGDLAGAEDAFRNAMRTGTDPQPGLALLRVAQGRPELAHSLLERAFHSPRRTSLDVARLAPSRVEVALLVGDARTAREACELLAATATEFGTDALAGSSAHAGGLVAQASGDLRQAEELFQSAALTFRNADLPYEAGQARLRLAEVYRAMGAFDLAGLEAESAASAFEELGAGPAAREARALLSDLGSVAESMTAAWMFTDIVGSTRLLEAIGDQAWSAVVRWHDDALRRCFAAHGGRELDRAGDGFFATFPDAQRAISCAVHIQRQLAAHRREHGYPARLRIGIHVGEAVQVGSSYTGKEIHVAARLAAAAAADQIVVTESAASVSPHPLQAAGAASLRGLDESVPTYVVDWEEDDPAAPGGPASGAGSVDPVQAGTTSTSGADPRAGTPG